MAVGATTSASIRNMFRTFIAEAMYTAEHLGVMDKSIDTKRLPLRMGTRYNEPYFGALVATDIPENLEFDNPQVVGDANISITPQERGCQVLWPDRLSDAMTESLPSIVGKLLSRAIEYKRDVDLLTMLDAVGGSLGGGTAACTVGIIHAALSAIREGIPLSGATARTGARSTGEPATSPLRVVLHERHRHDLMGQLSGLGGVPTQITGSAVTINYAGQSLTDYNARWVEQYYVGHIAGAMMLIDNNIPIVSNAAKGGAFERDAFVQVTYRGLRDYTARSNDGRFYKQTVIADYGFGIRKDVGGVELHLDATAPAV